MWIVYALLSALFAALTSILAKIGIEGVLTGKPFSQKGSPVFVLRRLQSVTAGVDTAMEMGE